MASNDLTRRRALKLTAIGIAAAAAARPQLAFADLLYRRLPWARSTADRPERIDDRPGYVFFSPAEADFVEAAADRLIPAGGAGPGAIQAGVPRFIDRQLAGPYGAGDHFYLQGPFAKGSPTQGWQSGAPSQVYRTAIAALDRWSATAFGRRFDQLSSEDQDSALKTLEEGKAALGDSVDGKAFFALLLQNVIEGYFADPLYGGNRNMGAWAMIGFPGARYDYRGFVSQHNTPFPLPPVGLLGRPGWKAG